MRRIAIGLALAVCAAAPTFAAGTSTPAVGLQGFVCQRGLDPAARAIAVTAVMRPVPGTAHMALRVVLLRRAQNGGAFAPVSGRDLGKWISPSNPTLGQRPGDIWRLVKQVVDLPAGSYRLRVAFRWTGSAGQTLATTSRRTPVCVQPELRPDLRVTKVSIVPSFSGQYSYVAVVRNAGRTAAGPFNVQLSVAGSILATKVAGPLPASTKTQVAFQGPACTAKQPVEVVADPEHKIDDANPANNALSVACSPPPPASVVTPAGSSRRGR
jgi:hypothetical protein